jgi:hypothetical protein
VSRAIFETSTSRIEAQSVITRWVWPFRVWLCVMWPIATSVSEEPAPSDVYRQHGNSSYLRRIHFITPEIILSVYFFLKIDKVHSSEALLYMYIQHGIKTHKSAAPIFYSEDAVIRFPRNINRIYDVISKNILSPSSTMKMESAGSSETLVLIYQNTWRRIQE